MPKIEKLENTAQNTFIFTNNHYRGAAITTARELKEMLEKAGENVS